MATRARRAPLAKAGSDKSDARRSSAATEPLPRSRATSLVRTVSRASTSRSPAETHASRSGGGPAPELAGSFRRAPQEKEDPGLLRSLAETTVDVVTEFLENEREDIATTTTLSGTLPRPDVGIWEAVIGLLRNAFVESISPEFERVAGAGG